MCLAALRMAPRSSSHPPATPTTGSFASARAKRPPRGRLSNRFCRSRNVRERRHSVRTTRWAPCARAAIWLGGSLRSLAAASSWSSEVPAAGTGAAMPEARSRLKITFASSGTQSAGAPLPRSRATAHTASPAAEAPSAAWSGMRSASAPAKRGAAAASAAPTAIRRIHHSTRFDSGCAAQCGEAGVTSPRALSRTASRSRIG